MKKYQVQTNPINCCQKYIYFYNRSKLTVVKKSKLTVVKKSKLTIVKKSKLTIVKKSKLTIVKKYIYFCNCSKLL